MKLIATVAMLSIASFSFAQTLSVQMKNNSSQDKDNASVVVEWSKIKSKIKKASDKNIIVLDNSGKQIPSQVLFEGGKEATGLLFQADVDKNKKVVYKIKTGKRQEFESKAFGRFVPERKDDFAWENNQIAFRMYGPALEATGEISQGIDIWVKSTDKLIINKWYKLDKYHTDHGEGLDSYKVGPSLGCGATAPIVGGKLVMSKNYTSYKVLENGPLRVSFELKYAPFKVGGKNVEQVRVITLDANTNLNSVSTTYTGNFKTLEVATGIVVRGAKTEVIDMGANYLAYSEPPHKAHGITYALVVTDGKDKNKKIAKHIVKTHTVTAGVPYVYKTGGYWSKGGIENAQDWKKTVSEEALDFNSPLEVVIMGGSKKSKK